MSKYLVKCPKCGELVEVCEYTMLCSHCKKKLDNSFKEIQKSNPDLTFQGYVDKYCVNSLAISGIKDQKKISKNVRIRKGLSRTIWTLISVFCATILILWVIWLCSSLFNEGRSIKQIVDSNWKNEYYEDLSCNIQFPYALQNVVSQPQDSTLGIQEYVGRSWKKEKVCIVTASKIEYTEDSISNINTATENILQSMVNENQMEGFQYVPSDYKVGGSSARMFSGSYLIDVELYEFRAIMVKNKSKLWFFMVAYPQKTPEGTILADKLFKGIQLLEN